MRFITISFLSIIIMNCYGQVENPFLSLKFDKVIICDFENDGEHDYPLINEKGQLSNVVKKSIQLDKAATSKLITKLGDEKSYGQVHADCNEPLFGIIFYKKNMEAAEVQICLGCNVLTSSLIIPAQKQGKSGKGKNVYYTREGMSKQFRQFINDLVKKYGFSHPIEPGEPFDR